ncbi:MAG: hypothetical protein P4L84_02135 [Isosphaeraceae bacterium]|nr:hypothetical protein [Isosphaeraceae bacterium]
MGELLFVAIVPLLALALVRLLDGATARSTRREQFLGWLRQTKLWHMLVAVALSAFIFASVLGPGPGSNLPLNLALLVVLGLLIRAWRHEFLFLMSLRDDDLPGRHDKLIWAIALLFAPPFGIWLFQSYREARWAEPTPLRGEPATNAS